MPVLFHANPGREYVSRPTPSDSMPRPTSTTGSRHHSSGQRIPDFLPDTKDLPHLPYLPAGWIGFLISLGVALVLAGMLGGWFLRRARETSNYFSSHSDFQAPRQSWRPSFSNPFRRSKGGWSKSSTSPEHAEGVQLGSKHSRVPTREEDVGEERYADRLLPEERAKGKGKGTEGVSRRSREEEEGRGAWRVEMEEEEEEAGLIPAESAGRGTVELDEGRERREKGDA